MALQDLRRLEAVCSDFYAFCRACEELEGQWTKSLAWRAGENGSKHFRPKHVDEVSRQIIPANFRRMSVVLITSTGDGNCLFNSASLAICQTETLAVELRLRTCLELAKNRQFYRNHPVLANARIPYCGKDGPCVMSVETLCDLTCFSSSSSKVYGDNGFERAFDHEIMRTCKNYSYSSTLQIMALASVLGVPIEMVYPDQKNKLLPVYQNKFHPRQPFNQSSLAVRIMWTNTLGWPDRSKEFVVNHFVPLFNGSDQASVGQVEAAKMLEENENLWFVVTNKQKSSAKINLSTGMHADGKTSRNPQDLRRWQKQKRTSSTRQKSELGKKERKPCNRENPKKEAEAVKKSRDDRHKDSKFEDLEARKEQNGEAYEGIPGVPLTKKKYTEDTANPHFISEDKTESGQNTKEKEDTSPNCDQRKQQRSKSNILQKKEKDHENSKVTNSEMCGQSKKEKQEIKCKTGKSEIDASATKKEKIEVERQKPDPQEEMKKDTNKRKNTTLEDGDFLPPTKRRSSCGDQTLYTPSNSAVKFIEDRSALPFPGASRRFYKKQNKTANANVKRTNRRAQLPVIQKYGTKTIGMQRSRVEESLEDNIEDIKREILTCNNRTRRAELLATVDVGRELQKSIILETSTAAAIFKKAKASILNEEEKNIFVQFTHMNNYLRN